MSKLSNEQVRWIREVYRPRSRAFGARRLSMILGVDTDTIVSIANGRSRVA